MEGAIVLFDGVCNLCNGAVQFILRRDPSGYFRFASLQSEAGRQLVSSRGRSPDELDSLYVATEDRLLDRSEAVLEIVRHLRQPWPVLGVFQVVPRGWRDALYDAIARRRYRWFGRRDTCTLPEPGWRERFLP